MTVNLVILLIVGLVAGWIASRLVKGGGFDQVGLVVVGVIGALIGGSLGALAGFATTDNIGGVIAAAIGAIIALSIFAFSRRLAARRTSRSRAAELRGRPDTELSESSAAKSGALKSVFVSYRRGDSADVTGRINDHLVHRFGNGAVFTDVDSIPLGVDFRQHLDKAVAQCEVLLAVVGPGWAATSDSSVGGASMPSGKDLPDSMSAFSYRQATKIRPDPDFQSDISRLIQSLDDHLRAR